MPRKTVPITGSVLAWAMEQAGLSQDELAKKLRRSSDEVRSWIEEESQPTTGIAKKVAEAVRRPLSVLMLPEPPQSAALPSALRTAVGQGERALSSDELRLTRRAKRFQRLLSWLKQQRAEREVTIPRVGGLEPTSAGDELRGWLNIPPSQQFEWESAKEAFEFWRDALEQKAIVVLQLQLGIGVRGFCIFDPHAPVIAVSTADNYQARSFTLFHELAHLSLGRDSACLERVGNRAEERWCDAVAGAILMPPDVLGFFLSNHSIAGLSGVDLVESVSSAFKVSMRAAAVSLIRQGILSQDMYQEVEERAPITDREKGFGRGRPQRAPQRRRSEFGARPISFVLDAMADHLINESDVRDYLRVDGTELQEIADELVVQ